jgi:hypothetical protein
VDKPDALSSSPFDRLASPVWIIDMAQMNRAVYIPQVWLRVVVLGCHVYHPVRRDLGEDLTNLRSFYPDPSYLLGMHVRFIRVEYRQEISLVESPLSQKFVTWSNQPL